MLTKSGVTLMTAELDNANDAVQLVFQLKSQGTINMHTKTDDLEHWFNNFSQKM